MLIGSIRNLAQAHGQQVQEQMVRKAGIVMWMKVIHILSHYQLLSVDFALGRVNSFPLYKPVYR